VMFRVAIATVRSARVSHFLPADASRVKWPVVYAPERLTNRPNRV